MELLNLARTTRALRAILMKRSSRLVWRTTIRNIGLPACPSDLDEPQYVNLAFDDYCHVSILTPYAKAIDDILMILVQVRELLPGYRRSRPHMVVLISVYPVSFVSDYDLCKLIPTSTVSGKSKAIFPFIVYPKPRPYKPGRILYYLPVVEQYKRELGQLAGDHDGKIVRQWSIRKKEEQDRRLTAGCLLGVGPVMTPQGFGHAPLIKNGHMPFPPKLFQVRFESVQDATPTITFPNFQ
ncbi:hypothetical protein H0H93_001009 [Arthromyces matolae]|nr:hypothetical protein H0H93_001009 [Arthromyces matolae]